MAQRDGGNPEVIVAYAQLVQCETAALAFLLGTKAREQRRLEFTVNLGCFRVNRIKTNALEKCLHSPQICRRLLGIVDHKEQFPLYNHRGRDWGRLFGTQSGDHVSLPLIR